MNEKSRRIDPELGLFDHLIELRSRLLRALTAVVLVVIVLIPFARSIYSALARPLMRQLPEGSGMVAIDVASPFLAPFKLVVLLALLLAMPIVLYQLWAFVAPGLYRHEKRLARPLLIMAVLLFYTGCAFAYFVVFPVVFAFFTAMAPAGVTVMTDISAYLDFVLMLFMAFGVAFQIPVVILVLVAVGVTTPAGLGKLRGYVVIGAFFFGMILTPPDVTSQTLLAVPALLLYELGIVLARLLVRRPVDQASS